MKTKIATAFKQIEKKMIIDSTMSKVHAVICASDAIDKLDYFVDYLTGFLDEYISSQIPEIIDPNASYTNETCE